jgi:TfdA family taurine catabolism dioxygenase TauD
MSTRGRFGARDDGTLYPEAEHPVIRTHPVSGRKALFVNRGFTTRIVQLKRDESATVLECLYRHIETPEFHCRFRWKPQSLEPRVRCVTAVDVLGQFDGLTNGTGGSMDALLGGRPPWVHIGISVDNGRPPPHGGGQQRPGAKVSLRVTTRRWPLPGHT